MKQFCTYLNICLCCLAALYSNALGMPCADGKSAYPDSTAWIDSAIIYEITPNAFVKHGTFNAITKKLPEIKELGINTIWLQPIYQTRKGGQGYDVTDYFTTRSDLGTEKQLDTLVSTAKKLGFRVIFDFVPNHTSIYHPFAQDYISKGKKSAYYSFYQHKNDGKPYSSFYQKDSNGLMCYFWDNLVNLDFNNRQTQDWILKAIKYWQQKYDLDGFRFDAMWGINARNPEFSKRLTAELRAIKPGILLLAEDKVSALTTANGFDAGYDWAPDTAWVSKWSWQTQHDLYKSFTIFNLKDSLKRKSLLENAIFKNPSSRYTSLRFIENNDVPRFIATHTLAQVKMAAALSFALPGIPMIYNGQETGSTLHPYSGKGIFKNDASIRSADSLHLFPFYAQLIKLRLQNPALLSTNMKEIPLTGNLYIIAFERWHNNECVIVVTNLSAMAGEADIDMHGKGSYTYISATDLLTNSIFSMNGSKTNLKIQMQPNSTRWLRLTNKV